MFTACFCCPRATSKISYCRFKSDILLTSSFVREVQWAYSTSCNSELTLRANSHSSKEFLLVHSCKSFFLWAGTCLVFFQSSLPDEQAQTLPITNHAWIFFLKDDDVLCFVNTYQERTKTNVLGSQRALKWAVCGSQPQAHWFLLKT